MLTNWMGYDILKEVSISDILEAKMKRTIGERLKKARKDVKIRQGAAAEKMEMSRTTLSAIESDKRLVWAEEITKFAEMYKVSANELLYGFADEFPEIEFEAFLGNSEIRMINYSLLYDRLNDKDKDKVMKYIVSLLEQQN